MLRRSNFVLGWNWRVTASRLLAIHVGQGGEVITVVKSITAEWSADVTEDNEALSNFGYCELRWQPVCVLRASTRYLMGNATSPVRPQRTPWSREEYADLLAQDFYDLEKARVCTEGVFPCTSGMGSVQGLH